MSENYIRIVKRKLYMTLRGTLNRNWVSMLEVVVNSMNNTPTPRLGWLKPSTILDESGSVLVSKARKEHHMQIYKEPNFKDQIENQIEFDKTNVGLKVGDYCYRDFDTTLFDKSYNVSVTKSFLFLRVLFLEYCLHTSVFCKKI